MSGRRRTEFWSDTLPMEWEGMLGFGFLMAWIVASIADYSLFVGRIDQMLAAFAPLGIKPDDAAFLPLIEMAFRVAPIAGFFIALRAWYWTRKKILRSFYAAL